MTILLRLGKALRAHCVMAVVLALVASALMPHSAAAQVQCQRFEIATARDTTFSFGVAGRDDILRGRTGKVVDPRRRDALVATFQVLRVDGGVATALVTGQTADVATTHIALVDEPKASSGMRASFRSATFWIGALLGVAAGVVVGKGI